MTSKLDQAIARVSHALAALRTPKTTGPAKTFDRAPIITAIKDSLPEKTVLPVQPVHAALLADKNGGQNEWSNSKGF